MRSHTLYINTPRYPFGPKRVCFCDLVRTEKYQLEHDDSYSFKNVSCKDNEVLLIQFMSDFIFFTSTGAALCDNYKLMTILHF